MGIRRTRPSGWCQGHLARCAMWIYCIIMKWETLQIKTLDSIEIKFCASFFLLFIIIIFYIWGRNVRNSSCICQPQRNWNVCSFIAADVCRLSSNAWRGRGWRYLAVEGAFRVWWEKKYEGNWSRTAGSNIQQIRYNNISYIISYLIDLVAALERLLHVIPEMAI